MIVAIAPSPNCLFAFPLLCSFFRVFSQSEPCWVDPKGYRKTRWATPAAPLSSHTPALSSKREVSRSYLSSVTSKVHIPSDLDRVNFPYTPGRSADAVSHLIFIRDLVDTTNGRAHNHSHTSMKKNNRDASRPHTAPAVSTAGVANSLARAARTGEQEWRRKVLSR